MASFSRFRGARNPKKRQTELISDIIKQSKLSVQVGGVFVLLKM